VAERATRHHWEEKSMLRGRALVLVVVAGGLFAAGCSSQRGAPKPETATPAEPVRSADWIAALPEGEIRRQVILGCTPCHQLGPPVAHRQSLDEWRAVIARMKKIDDDLDLALIRLDTEELAQWLARNARMPKEGYAVPKARADIREYAAGAKAGFYHDMTVSAGRVWIADYFGNKLYGMDVSSGAVESHDLPVDVKPGKPGGAHQIDVTRDGMIWITFTKSEQVIRFDPQTRKFRVYNGFEKGGNVQYFVVDADRYVYQDQGGGIWMTHFSREILSRLDPRTGQIRVYQTPRTPGMSEKGVHLYAAVADSRGRLWYTETHGNRLGMLDPKTGKAFEFDMPEKTVGPKRLAIDKDDVLWIPELAVGKISVYDTRTRRFTDRLALPIPGDFPYGIRRNRYTGDLWVTGSGSDSLYRLDPKTRQFTVYRLPRLGAYTRTVAFDEQGNIWTNYASFPNPHTRAPNQPAGIDNGIVVRLRPEPAG
jgi:streptogramin lyase